MSLVVIETDELDAMIAKHLQPLREEINRLLVIIETDSKHLSLKDFASRSGRSEQTIRGLAEAGKIKFHQARPGCKITIPASEINKIKQL